MCSNQFAANFKRKASEVLHKFLRIAIHTLRSLRIFLAVLAVSLSY